MCPASPVSYALSAANRAYLRKRSIRATIAIPDNQTTNRRNRGSDGGRPPAFDSSIYRDRNAVERCINHIKQNKAVALRADKLAIRYQATPTVTICAPAAPPNPVSRSPPCSPRSLTSAIPVV